MEYIDLRSDTVTVPTKQMRQSIMTSQYGDHMYGEDPTVIKFEKEAAQMMGKQDASYVPSGTFGNLCTLMSFGQPGQEVLLSDYCHIIQYENGSAAKYARLMTRTMPCKNGIISVQTLKATIRKLKDSQAPKTTMLCLENPTCTGNLYPIQQFHELCQIAKAEGLHVHLDGARIFNAVAQYGIDVKQVIKYCDTVMFCFSKGLSSPIGSVVVGAKQGLKKFKQVKRMLGGGMRKPGVVVGSCMISLKKMTQNLKKDNEIARKFTEQLSKLSFIQIVNKVETNIIIYMITDPRVNTVELLNFLNKNKVKCFIDPGFKGKSRFVVHHYIREPQIQKVIKLLKQFHQNNVENKPNLFSMKITDVLLKGVLALAFVNLFLK